MYIIVGKMERVVLSWLDSWPHEWVYLVNKTVRRMEWKIQHYLLCMGMTALVTPHLFKDWCPTHRLRAVVVEKQEALRSLMCDMV